jgi:hypothetical protein
MASGLSYLDHRFGFFVFSLYFRFQCLDMAELAIQIIPTGIFMIKVLIWHPNSYPLSHREYFFNL